MTEFNIRRLIYITVAVILSILAFKLFIWLLPIIIVIILASFIYKIIKKIHINIKENDDTVETIKRSKTKNTSKTKTKKIIIIDEESND